MKCKNLTEECQDKNSTHYFMCHMTQEDFDERIKWSELRRAHEVQYHLNKIRSKSIDNLDEQ